MSIKFGKSFKPMLLSEKRRPFDSEDYIYELKFDGFRAILHIGPDCFKIFSRNGQDITDSYPELKSIKKLVKKNYIIDGEIVSFENDRPSFSKLQKRSRLKNDKKILAESLKNPVCFVAFDLLFDGSDLTSKPLLFRKKELAKIKDDDFFVKATYIKKEGIRLFQKVKNLKLEGIVAKKIDSTYSEDYRTPEWIKIKNTKIDMFTIFAYSIRETKPSLYLAEKKSTSIKYVGKVSISKTHPFSRSVIATPRTRKPLITLEEEDLIYIKPSLKCEIEYLEKTSKGILRHPVFRRNCE